MGKRTELFGENMTLTTAVRVLAAFQTGSIGQNAANVRITRVEISQSTSTTLGMVRGDFATRDTAGTLTTTSTTPRTTSPLTGPGSGLNGNTSVIGAVARSGTNATVDSGGTYTSVHPFAFPNLNGYLYKPDPKEELWVPPSTVFVVRFLADPATLTGWTITVGLEED
jgi:hypothetical protein